MFQAIDFAYGQQVSDDTIAILLLFQMGPLHEKGMLHQILRCMHRVWYTVADLESILHIPNGMPSYHLPCSYPLFLNVDLLFHLSKFNGKTIIF